MATTATSSESLRPEPSLNDYLKESKGTSGNSPGYPGVTGQEVLSLSSSKVINQRAFGNNIGIPMGGILNCIPRDVAGLPHITKEPTCCGRCGAFINPFSKVEMQIGRWFCTFCGGPNTIIAKLSGNELEVAPELANEAVEYVEAPVDVLPSVGLSRYSSVIVVVDATLDEANMKPAREALKTMLRNLHQNTMISILSFDACVSLYNLAGNPRLVDARTIPGHTTQLPKGSRKILSANGPRLFRVGSCLPMAELVLDCICAQKEAIYEQERPRCLGTALHEALILLQDQRSNKSDQGMVRDMNRPRMDRIMLLAGGPTNYGPGATQASPVEEHAHPSTNPEQGGIKVFMKLAAIAQGMGVPVDLFGIGPSSVGVAELEPLTRATGGSISIHSAINAAMLACSMQSALCGTFGTGGLLDVRLSSGLQLVSVIGNVFEQVGTGESGVRKLSKNACSVRSLEAGKGLGLWIEATKDLDQQDLFIQVMLSWKTPDGFRVERVVTRKLTPTGNLVDYMKSIEPGPASVLLAKKVVLDTAQAIAGSKAREAQDVRLALSSRLNYLAQKFGKVLEAKSGLFGFGSKQKWSCPQELSVFAHALYHLQRGPMLGPQPCHASDRAFLHSMFLSGSLASAQPMLIPRMYELDPTSLNFREVPPVDLALKDDTAMLLDHGSHMLVWLGSSVLDNSGIGNEPSKSQEVEVSSNVQVFIRSCERFAEVLCKGRTPIPDLRIVMEGQDSMNWVLSRVVPGRRDQAIDKRNQLSRAISAEMTATEKVIERLPYTQEPSLYEWCRNANVEPPRQDLARAGSMSGLPKT